MPQRNPIYEFIDDQGTFIVRNPGRYNLYLPLTDKNGELLSAISPDLSGDIKSDNEHFLTPPSSILDLKNNPLVRREFYLKVNSRYLRLSAPRDNDILEAGLLYHKLVKRAFGLRIEITNFIPYNCGVELMRVRIMNTSNRVVNILPTSFIPLYGRAEKNLRDHRHVTSLLNRVKLLKHGIDLCPTMVFNEKGHTLNKTHYFVLGFEGEGVAPAGQFPTIDYFCGEGSIDSPDAIFKGVKAARKNDPIFNGKEACAALRFKARKLRPREEISYCLVMGIGKDLKVMNNAFRRFNTPAKVEEALSATKKYWRSYLDRSRLDFKGRDFNNWLLWVKLQPTLRKLFGCSFLPHFDYGKGGRGWRDLWQDSLALLLTEPLKAKEAIIHNFSGVRVDGSNATIITRDGSFIADRNQISRVWMDHGVWPYLTLRSYLHKTADLNILLKEAPYFRDHQLKRAKETDKDFHQKDYLLRDKRGRLYQGILLEHVLIQNLVQFFNVGEHNIIRLENADWNDGLDMAPERGESVAFSFMYAHNLGDICIFLEGLKRKNPEVKLLKEIKLLLDTLNGPINYDNYRAKQKRLNKYLERVKNIDGERVEIKVDDLISDLRKKSSHLAEWLREEEWMGSLGFFNGYYDNLGQRVEGLRKGRVRMMLPAQVFAILSGVATDKEVRKIFNAVKGRLQDKKLGGFHLNTDFGKPYPELGRAFGFSYGDKENGAFFNHMNVMLAHALYKRGFVKEAEEVLGSIYRMCLASEAKIYPSLPEYFNAQGKGLYSYLTGSASWYIYTLSTLH